MIGIIELELTEGRSTGIPKMLREMAKNGSPAPEFETDENRSYSLVRLPVHAKADWKELAATSQVEGLSRDQVEGLSRDLVTHPVEAPSRHQVEVLRKCLEMRSIVDLMEAVGRTNRTKFRHQVLKPLLKAALVEMTQPEASNTARPNP
jgi:ATP-dependent DNA helicase RecG